MERVRSEERPEEVELQLKLNNLLYLLPFEQRLRLWEKWTAEVAELVEAQPVVLFDDGSEDEEVVVWTDGE